MVLKRVTMQQLADACGLSRNTVSKVFNDRGSVPEATRQTVLQHARELGYYQGETEAPASPPPRQVKIVALLTQWIPVDAHFGTFFLPAFTERLSRAGYTLMMYEVAPDDVRACRLPAHMPLEQTVGISIFEMFNQSYMDMLCALGLPCISVDTCAELHLRSMQCDLIMMENLSSAIALTRHVIEAGGKKIGFIGDPVHCESFHQRWSGFCRALDSAGLALDPSLCIVEPDGPNYSDEDWLLARIRQMPQTPDALVCANDFLALHVIAALKRLHLAIPGDVMVTGFDGTPQSAVVEPSLTTAQIPNSDIGRMAAEMLLDRIQHPDMAFRCMYVNTTPQWRMSTKR